MSDVVLVHGAWQGAWCWDLLRPHLEAFGARVITPTLTGSGARHAELAPTVTLADHINDVVNAITDDDLHDVVLVGHSYSGMVITGVAERIAERLGALVFVDAFYPDHGQSAYDQLPTPFQSLFRDNADRLGDGWRLPATDGLLDAWGLHDPQLRAIVGPQLTDWSLNCFTSAVEAPLMRRAGVARHYISANADAYPAKAAFGPISERARADGCALHHVRTGHDVMIEAPAPLAEILRPLAA